MKHKIAVVLCTCAMLAAVSFSSLAAAYKFDENQFQGPGMEISGSQSGYYYRDNGPTAAGVGTWEKDETGWWWQRANGSYPVNTWQQIDGYYYHFDARGYMTTGWVRDGAEYYYTNQDGVWIPDAYPEVAEILKSGDLKRAYDYSVLPYTKGATDPALGTRYFAEIAYRNRTGNCYVMAAAFAELAKAMGYNARQMTGYVGMRTGGIGPHSWVEIDGTVYDPDFEAERGTDGFGIQYGQKGTWKYQQYTAME